MTLLLTLTLTSARANSGAFEDLRRAAPNGAEDDHGKPQCLRLPADLSPSLPLDGGHATTLHERCMRQLEPMSTSREFAQRKREAVALEAKRRYDALVRNDPLNVDESEFIGPFKVTEKGDNGIFKLRTPDGQIKPGWVHRASLKRIRRTCNIYDHRDAYIPYHSGPTNRPTAIDPRFVEPPGEHDQPAMLADGAGLN
ncbi:hypothetical protein RI367_002480 [Sorochytrium milnesiophthora]